MSRLFLLAPIVLAACSTQPTVKAENASVAEVADAAREAISLQPGQWSTTVDVTELKFPGVDDPRVADAMGGMMKKAQAEAHSYCVTPEQAAKPSAELFAGKANGDCRYDTFTMAGGRIDAAMTCTGAGTPGSMTMTTSGTYSSTAYDVAMNMKVANPAMPGGAMTMKARTKGARTGDCKA